MNPLDRAEQRRTARAAITAVLSGLDAADRQALLEDALADMYAAAATVVDPPPITPTPARSVSPPTPPNESLSLAKRVLIVMGREPGRVFSVEAIATALPGTETQQIRNELSRLKRKESVVNRGRGLYQMPSNGGVQHA